MTQPSFPAISKILEDADFSTYLPEVNQENPIEQLFVSIRAEEDKDPLMLQMMFVNDLAKAMGVEAEEADAALLQFFVGFPFVSKPSTHAQVASLILTLNRILPVGALGMSEQEGTIYYQYVLAMQDREPSENVLLEVVSMITLFVLEFAEKLQTVSSGEKTAENVLEEMKAAGLVIPPVMPPPGTKQ